METKTETIRVNFHDEPMGMESASDRVNRAIVLMMSTAMDEVEKLGYDREKDMLEIKEGDWPSIYFICLHGRPVFRVGFDLMSRNNTVKIDGKWLRTVRPKAKGWAKLAFWRKSSYA